MTFIEKWNKNEKIVPDAPKNESGIIQMIMMGKSIRHKWVKWCRKAKKLEKTSELRQATTTLLYAYPWDLTWGQEQ